MTYLIKAHTTFYVFIIFIGLFFVISSEYSINNVPLSQRINFYERDLPPLGSIELLPDNDYEEADSAESPPGKLFGTDLSAMDTQRGRDHGLPPYVHMVRYCSGGRVNITSFGDLVQLMDLENIGFLRKTYSFVEDIDLWVGLQMENHFPQSEVGPTSVCLIAKQFYFLKFGDRFYFEHKGEVPSFTAAQRKSLKQCSLARILCDNTPITHLQKNVMLLPSFNNPEIPCSQIPEIDLTPWKETVQE
ncbi:peroxidase [Nephila pilipes]|uniref:Peroxidase n=1 Tax=Nephila pilipes TaxID=299642 RepID=A0A8X6TCN9_NEPPI|nr:peroxidase [Nephila pilipes]